MYYTGYQRTASISSFHTIRLTVFDKSHEAVGGSQINTYDEGFVGFDGAVFEVDRKSCHGFVLEAARYVGGVTQKEGDGFKINWAGGKQENRIM